MTIDSARKMMTSLACGLMLVVGLSSAQAQDDAPAPSTPNVMQVMPVGHQQNVVVQGAPIYQECDCDNCRSGRLKERIGRCKVSPGTGYAPPGKAPIVRTNVGYGKYWPDYWSGNGYGTPIAFNPAVYTPTDTTQLGFYYQTVPTWVPMPWMQPTDPVPSQWHRYGWGGAAYPGYGNYNYGPANGTQGGYCPPSTTVTVPGQTYSPEVAIEPIPEGSI